MANTLQLPAESMYGPLSGSALYAILYVIGLLLFAYIVARRLQPLVRAQRDQRFDRPMARLRNLVQFWLVQWRQPRYRGAGLLHILIFAGFLILATRAFSLLFAGLFTPPSIPWMPEGAVQLYSVVADYAATLVFACMIVAIVRRAVFKPKRYSVPPQYGKGRASDAIFLLSLIAILMAADALVEASRAASELASASPLDTPAIFTLSWLLTLAFSGLSSSTLFYLYHAGFLLHALAFFFLLCYRPFGIQFHVETSLFSIYFAKLDRGAVKPVRWDIPDDRLDQVKSFGVKTFEDFTWKHVLDFYSCADCGRCSEQCPSATAGRALSPRFFTIKARDYCFKHFPVFGTANNGQPVVGNLYSEDEIWSCTTCGACEAECPLLIEYIDKIVDLRRGLVDSGLVPQSLQKPLKALEARGNPFGKPEKKRTEWAQAQDGRPSTALRILNGKTQAEALYFVDSMTSYDARAQSIARSTARVLHHMGEDFGVLGPAERDSGHDVRRFGEETLFQALRDHNSEAIRAAGVRRVVTNDPHAFNALKHDYKDAPPVEHISQVIARGLRDGRARLAPVENTSDVYVYHDPCYLGRHNGVFDEPRAVLDAIPGMKRVEMRRCRDRSFCCGGGGLALFYENKEERRIGVTRVEMAAEAGATVIVTACPFCMTHIEDGIKVAGLEGKMSAIDLTELVDRQMVRERIAETATVSAQER